MSILKWLNDNTLAPPLHICGSIQLSKPLDLDVFSFSQVSSQLVIAYAIAGRIDIDFEREPLGFSYSNGAPVFLSQIWPTQKEVQEAEHGLVIPAIFRQVKKSLSCCSSKDLVQMIDASAEDCFGFYSCHIEAGLPWAQLTLRGTHLLINRCWLLLSITFGQINLR